MFNENTILMRVFFISVVTIYATLGEEAIAHGINETEVSLVITSHDLLPKFKNVLSKTPKVKKIIYMEDQLAKTDISGFKTGVDIIPFSEVLKSGELSDIGKFLCATLMLMFFWVLAPKLRRSSSSPSW
jgi:hypothetical protein